MFQESPSLQFKILGSENNNLCPLLVNGGRGLFLFLKISFSIPNQTYIMLSVYTGTYIYNCWYNLPMRLYCTGDIVQCVQQRDCTVEWSDNTPVFCQSRPPSVKEWLPSELRPALTSSTITQYHTLDFFYIQKK